MKISARNVFAGTIATFVPDPIHVVLIGRAPPWRAAR